MNLQQLLYFVTIVEFGSFSKAARELKMTQPPLTAQMKALEKELGVQLLERSPKGVTLTKAGEEFFARVVPLVQTTQYALDELKQFPRTVSPTVKINMEAQCSKAVLDHYIIPYKNENPKVHFDISEAFEVDDLLYLNEWIADFLICSYIPHLNTTFQSLCIIDEPYYIVGKLGQFHKKKSFSSNDIATYPLAIAQSVFFQLEALWTTHNTRGNIEFTCNDFHSAIVFSLHTDSFAIIPESYLNQISNTLEVHPIHDEDFRFKTYILTSDYYYSSEAGKQFYTYIKEHLVV